MSRVLVVADVGPQALIDLLERYGLELVVQAEGATIRGTFWGGAEAGVVGHTVYVRPDTPLHSFLHESCHIICMDAARRECLERDAGGDDLEEAAVCYLQILLADFVDGVDRERLLADMDAWGYSFRLGSTAAWFDDDAQDAREFLQKHNLIDTRSVPTFSLRR